MHRSEARFFLVEPWSWEVFASSTRRQGRLVGFGWEGGQLGCLTRTIWSRGPANCRWTCNMSKKQTFFFFEPEVGKLSWPESEYFRLVAAAQLCCCSKEAAVHKMSTSAHGYVLKRLNLPKKVASSQAINFPPPEALRIAGCLFLCHEPAILTMC